MSKKMKGVAFDSSYEDARARFKHQTLLQDYIELQQETEAARNKLEAMKQKKLTLQAEVSFLSRRHKFLLKNKSSTPQQEKVVAKPKFVETTKQKKNKRAATFRSLPSIQNVNKRERVRTETKNALPSKPPPPFDSDRKVKHGFKEPSLHRAAVQAASLNRRVKTNGAKGNNPSPVSQKERTFSSTEVAAAAVAVQSRIPRFDLNEISREEEEMQESFEEQRNDLIRNGIDEQQSDLKLPMCRNVGDGSTTSRSGKRKISWQDPVALRV